MPARVGDTVNPQPVLPLAPMRRVGSTASPVSHQIKGSISRWSRPGSAIPGTPARSCAAPRRGRGIIVLGQGSVDAYNPKVVRASAGACFAVRIVEGMAAMEIVERLGANGVACLGAAAAGGTPPETFDLRAPTAFVLGHETQGLGPTLPLSGTVTLPMAAEVAQRGDGGRRICCSRPRASERSRRDRRHRSRRTKAESLAAEGAGAFAAATTLDGLAEIERRFLGKTGALNEIREAIKSVDGSERAVVGKAVSAAKATLEAAHEARREVLDAEASALSATRDRLDLTLGPHEYVRGHLHPVTRIWRELEDVFVGLGYKVAEGPRGRDRLVQLRGAQLPARSPGARCRTRSTCGSASRRA